jgi:hypothetical protein
MKYLSYFFAIIAAGVMGMSTAAQARSYDHGSSYGNYAYAPQQRFERRVDRRQARQWERIADGIDSGELSRGEAKRLMRSQRRIARMENRFERDGYLSPHERRKLERALDRTSKKIKRAKHNDLPRHGYHRGWGHRYYTVPSAYAESVETYIPDDASGTISVQFDDFNVSWSPAYQY